MIDGVGVQDHQLQGFGELKYPLDLALNLRCTDDTQGDLPSLNLVDRLVHTWARSPKLERVLDRSMMGRLLRTDLLAKERSAVTRVIEILPKNQKKKKKKYTNCFQSDLFRLSTLLFCSACR